MLEGELQGGLYPPGMLETVIGVHASGFPNYCDINNIKQNTNQSFYCHYIGIILNLSVGLQRFLFENICNDYKQESNLPYTEVSKYQSMLRRNDTFFRKPVKDHCHTGVAHQNYLEAFLFFSFKDTIFKLIFKLACRLVGFTMKSAYMYCSCSFSS